jgi:methylthioribose-1-phosphate isomerase
MLQQYQPALMYLFVPLVWSLLQVVVAEAAPGYDGHAMASQLSQAKVQTTLIADSAVFAMMARVNKVGWYCGLGTRSDISI